MAAAAKEDGGGGGGDGIEWSSSYWENFPSELLREIFKRVEETEPKWPQRKHVVACAGVCKSWRAAMKEVVMTPEVSGKITFPISVKQPGPRDSILQCFIKRDRSTQSFHLYLNLTEALIDDGKFLLAARRVSRPTCIDYIISLNADDMSKGSGAYIGKLRSNFLGTKFVAYDALPPHAKAQMVNSCSPRRVGSKQVSPRAPSGSYPVVHVSYELNVLGARGPRKMQCLMNAIPASAIKPGGETPTQMDFPSSHMESRPAVPFLRSRSNCSRKTSAPSDIIPRDGSLILKNKSPRWHQQLQCWCLNFQGRVTAASVKNFQLVASPENGETWPEYERIILQFGKVENDVFTMDYCYPLSAFQAFSICLTTFDSKIGCE